MQLAAKSSGISHYAVIRFYPPLPLFGQIRSDGIISADISRVDGSIDKDVSKRLAYGNYADRLSVL